MTRLLGLLWDAIAWLAVQGIEWLLWPLMEVHTALVNP